MASVPPLYDDPNQRRKLPSLTNSGQVVGGLHDQMDQSLTGAPTNTGPMAPVPNVPNTEGTSRPPTQTAPVPATPALPTGWEDAGNGMVLNPSTGQRLPTNHPAWQQILSQSQPATAPTAPGGVVTAPPVPADTGAPTTPAPVDIETPYKAALLKQLEQAGTPASLTDPALKGQADAFSLAQTRAKERARSALAERAAGEGGTGTSSGAFNNDLVGLEQQQGESEGGFNASLVGEANKQKLAQMQSTLARMGSDIDSAAGRALQQKIADMQTKMQRDALAENARQANQSAENQRLGITSQSDLGRMDIGLRDKLGTAGLNAQIAQMLLNNLQFGQGLGADLSKFGASLNQNALLNLLGGLG